LGVPVDVHVACAERQITLTVEANRDTKTHRVHSFSLLPGLCRVPDDGASHLVLPYREGALVRAGDVSPPQEIALPVWDAHAGVTMPFFGAVVFTTRRRAPLSPWSPIPPTPFWS
jgi:hypothetical protein